MMDFVKNFQDVTIEHFSNGTSILDRFKKDEIWIEPKFPISYDKDSVKNLVLPKTGGWEGKVGDSTWKPDPDTVPDPENKKRGNPGQLSWREILNKYGIEGIDFKDNEPDFSEVMVAEVEINDFTESRQKNFSQADVKLAESWTAEAKDGKVWSPRDVAEYRKSENLTWHECKDCKTMQLVPCEIHNNVPHAGGISEIKKLESNLGG